VSAQTNGHNGQGPDRRKLLEQGNIAFGSSAGTMIVLVLGALGAIATALAVLMIALSSDELFRKVGLAALNTGFTAALMPALGALAMVMVFHQVNAGWAITVRRQFENLFAPRILGFFAAMFVAVFLLSAFFGPLWKWMKPEYVAGDVVFEHKEPFLNTPFFLARAVVYFAVWFWLGMSLYRFSRRTDETGDKWLMARARRRSSYGIPLLALTAAFAAFDWQMSLDYHWFSTMFGVYFFAGSLGSAVALATLVLLILRRAGKLEGLVTVEHFHDLAKLMFGFTVFWAYIGFSQYFLIWYANIPEETAWFWVRNQGDFQWLSLSLVIGRFIVPFLVLMPRPARRSTPVLWLASLWMLAFHVFDIFWVVRPNIYDKETYDRVFFSYVDIPGVLGPILLFAALVASVVTSTTLIPKQDPRLDEAIRHKNYI